MNCANPDCGHVLDVDHVTLVTTTHVRRFCSVGCIAKGERAHLDALFEDPLINFDSEPPPGVSSRRDVPYHPGPHHLNCPLAMGPDMDGRDADHAVMWAP
ncbi:MAG: hypothetical protein ACREN4_06440 [Candidatus Dormibacteria bacterium]